MWKLLTLCTIVILSFISFSLSSQTQGDYVLADTVKANYFRELSLELIDSSNYELALEKIDSSLIIYYKLFGDNSKESIPTLHAKGKLFYYRGLYPKALEYWEQALDICENKDSNNTKLLLSSKSNVAIGYRQVRRFDEAEQLLLEVLEMEAKINGEDSEKSAETYALIGNLYRSMNKFDEGIVALEKAIKIYSLHFEENSLVFWRSFQHIGVIKEKQGKYEEALDNYYKVLEIQTTHLPSNHIRMVTANERIGLVLLILNREQEGLELLQKVTSDRLAILGENHPAIISSYINLGVAYGRNGLLLEQRNSNLKALSYSNKILGEESLKTAKILFNLSYTDIRANRLQNVKKNLDKSYRIYCNYFGENSFECAIHYNEYGNYYSLANDYEKAISFHSKALKLRLDRFNTKNHFQVAYSYQNLGIVFWQMKEYERAILNLEEATLIFENLNQYTSTYNADILTNMGTIYSEKGDFSQSKYYHQQAVEIYQKKFPKGHPNQGSIFHNIAKNHYRQKDYKNAIVFYYKALEFKESHKVSQSSYSFKTYVALADLHAEQNNQDSCMYYYDKALSSIEFNSKDIIRSIGDIDKAIKVSHAKAWYYYRTNTNYPVARDCYNQTIDLIKTSLGYRDIRKSEANISEYISVYREAIELNSKFEFANVMSDSDIFSLSESLRSFYLNQALQNSNALSFSNIPDTLIQKESDLKIEIAYYDKKIQEKLAAGLLETDSTVLALSSERFNLNQNYEDLMLLLENGYPDYYTAKYDLSTISLEETQTKLLKPNQSLVEYVAGDSFLYTIVVNPDTFIINETKMDFPLNEWVIDFREGVTSYHTKADAPSSLMSKMTTEYIQNATQLYDVLIKPVAPYLNEDVVIVPDGVLGYLPFEILLKEKPRKLSNFHNYPYLLNDHTISYCYSATLLNQMKNRKHVKEPTKSSLAIAPFYEGDTNELLARVDTMQLIALRSDTLQSLQFSGEEAAKVAKMTKGDELIGNAASIQSFKEIAPDYRMLHLSTHGIANDKIGDYAYLAFGDKEQPGQYEKLFIRDIYNLPLNADMVVLSACNTAYGKLQKGEGVISMARAFAYAGAKSIITTHWSVDDASTGTLMEEFYKQLIKNRSTKDEALRAAKLNFIKSHKGLKAHPYFWAAFVAIGDMEPIQN